MRKKHLQTLSTIFSHPAPTSIRWGDAIALLVACKADIKEREGSRTAVLLNGEFILLHRPHPSNEMDKGAVASLRRFLEQANVKPG